MVYPKWLYSASKSVLIRSQDEETALQGEWFDSPAKVGLAPEAKAEVTTESMPVDAELSTLKEDQEVAVEVQEKRRGRPPKAQ